MIRVVIVADSYVVRAGLASVIGAEQDIQIVATIEHPDARNDGVSLRSLVSVRETDVVVLVSRRSNVADEMLLPDEGDLDERPHGPATMVLLERMDMEAARDAYAGGASAVLAVDTSAEELLAALRAIAAGLVVIQPGVSTELLAPRALPTSSSSTSQAPVSLTPREQEVLTLLAEGLPNKVIAPRLGITEHTVKTHVAAVYEKLNARNRAEAVVAAARQGLIML